jgi:hypothetical protein
MLGPPIERSFLLGIVCRAIVDTGDTGPMA